MNALRLRNCCAERTSGAWVACTKVAFLAGIFLSLGASHRTENFVVTAPNKSLAVEIANAAEQFREELAIEWLGESLPRWQQPCPITAQVGEMGAGGATSFMFERGVPFGWRMSIQGSRERILDSVLPHEVTHTIFATHFGRPLPRWADEGACTSVEHPSERARQDDMLVRFLKSNPPRSIPFNQMYRMTEYPHDIMPLYAQGHSVARFLLKQGGKRKFVDYVGRGMQTEAWDEVTNEFYGYRDLSELQLDWIDWVAKGSPNFGSEQGGPAALAMASNRGANFSTDQSPLTITTPLPPLLRPTDREMDSVRNAMDREDAAASSRVVKATASASAANTPVRQASTDSQSWYASQKNGRVPSSQGRQSEGQPPKAAPLISRPDLAPRSLLPPAVYSNLKAASAIQWRHQPTVESTASSRGRTDSEMQLLRRPEKSDSVHFDAPISGTFLR